MKLLKRSSLIILNLMFVFTSINSQNLHNRFSGINIGDPKIKGSTTYNSEQQTFILKGAGDNIWFDNDQFWFIFQKIKGDFIFSSRVEFIGEGTDPHRKIGLMARNAFDANSAYVDVCVHGDGLTGMQYRAQKGNNTEEINTELSSPDFIQLERKGKEFIVRIAKDGKPLVEVGKKEFELADELRIGMFISSHNPDVIESARFSNVRIEIPAAEGVSGYENPSASRLEIIDIESGLRRIIYETDEHIEAPNWSRDGSFLIYNSNGRLYKFDSETRKPEEINTGFAVNNNNDHGISFDGKTIAISNHLEENGTTKSIIFTVPIEGGEPTRVTPNGPSYWHGWSPDDKWLTYCAARNGNYDVYKIPVDGGDEIRLTDAEGLDDGPEYSPDGKYIYFNSVRSGMMEIWRMKPDGTEEEQVTDDNFQNWFAHPSPDGKWLIMISYPSSVPAGSHPHNQRVMLRMMPAAGGPLKTVAYLYGGQGTINVPSWSPDSKKVAFVSYTY